MKKICCLVMFVLMTGFWSPSPAVSAVGQSVIHLKAVRAFALGVRYMGQGRYLLAREQFSEAAEMAVTQGLRDDALAGMSKVNGILQNRRQYHE